jgi:hypothetical protein
MKKDYIDAIIPILVIVAVIILACIAGVMTASTDEQIKQEKHKEYVRDYRPDKPIIWW